MINSRFSTTARRSRRAGAIAAAATCLLLAGCNYYPPGVDARTLFNPYYYSGPVPVKSTPTQGSENIRDPIYLGSIAPLHRAAVAVLELLA
jgi:hypothetical protein